MHVGCYGSTNRQFIHYSMLRSKCTITLAVFAAFYSYLNYQVAICHVDMAVEQGLSSPSCLMYEHISRVVLVCKDVQVFDAIF